MKNYKRYKHFTNEGKSLIVPFIKLKEKSSDFFETYEVGKTRLDTLSELYYKSPDFAWLILQANPQYGSLEFLIPDGSEIRIPYPLGITLEEYEFNIKEYEKIYGIE